MTHPNPTSGDARDDQTGRFVTQPNGHVRPLSPHMSVWRWHITMAASILHLCHPSSRSITGACLTIDGGTTA